MKIPNSFDEITVEQYQFSDKILARGASTDAWINILSYLSGKEQAYYEEMKFEKLQPLIDRVQFLTRPTDIVKINDTIIIDNQFYKGLTDITKGNYGQYASLKTILAEGDDKKTENLHRLLGCIYAPVQLYGLEYDQIQTAEIMKQAKVGQVLGLVFFYSKVLEYLTPIINDYLKIAEEAALSQASS